jgi:glycosyltransferase involved in cell wall biosynthesis
MKRVLIISPHFPPDSSAGTHRARLLSKWLPAAGWEPTVLTVDERDYESRLDPALASLVPPTVRVIRVRALPRGLTRPIGFGDLGLRALPALRHAARRLVRRESFDVAYITIYPSYTAVIGRTLAREFGIPFILDYQDPWVGAWGLTVGGGNGGVPDLKSRITRRIALALEPRTLRAASGVTAVSRATFDEVVERNPFARSLPFLELPIGSDPDDMHAASAAAARIDRSDGLVHVVYVGTVLPLGLPPLRIALEALKTLRERADPVARRIRFNFFGTSNQSAGGAARVLPIAHELGLGDVVTEEPDRLDFLDALGVLRDAHAILLLGSSESHYTPSKLYPALMSGRPLLGVYHPASTARTVLDAAAADRPVEFIAYDPSAPRTASSSDAAASALERIVAHADSDAAPVATWMAPFTARNLAGRLGEFMDALT